MRHFIDARGGYYVAGDDIPQDPADVEVPPRPTVTSRWDGSAWVSLPPRAIVDALSRQYGAAIQSHLDAVAQRMGYDSIFTAVTYAEEPAVPQFQADGRALRAWRSRVWEHGYAMLAAAAAGLRPPPTIDQLLAELPQLPTLEL